MTSSKKHILIPAALVAVLLLGLVARKAWNFYYDRKVPNFSKTTELYVRPGTTAASLERYILDSCAVRSAVSFRRAFKEAAGGEDPRPGHYTITDGNTSAYVARMLARGWQTPVKLVLSGTMRQQGAIARKISNQMMLDSVDVIRALRDSALLAGYGFTREDVFGLFVPDTYEVYWTASMKDILDRQKEAYDAFWTDANKEKARLLGLSQKEVSVLASIVGGETNYEPEMATIAGVYLNRLRIGMPLQADPTVAYCFDYQITRVLKKHLEVDSPFNTYKHTGLPPAPIAVPSRSCLHAVLNPDRRAYFYFCASPEFDGTHRFAATLTEHNRNAAAYQRALTLRQRTGR
ncbi:MAG: endolytic transglycosylase MltG [Bacteroidales bacterium]|nr:endolytic transglycosylase MltG [Bacteroidales bacterium]